MIKFAHLADCHLGGWRQPELQDLNFKSFQYAIKLILEEKPDFILISGDLFDSAYPPIEILKETFAEFKKLSDAKIPVYLIAGSHDFSSSGKTFLEVLEKSGFCKNVANFEFQSDGNIKLKPHMHGDIAIFGYPGRKSGMEIEDLKKVYFDSFNKFTIFMLHTTINEVAIYGMESIDKRTLPLANYYALGHIHQARVVEDSNQFFVYPGPVFPNNFQELSDLQRGSFQITEIDGKIKTRNIKIPSKEVVNVNIEIENALIATEEIISTLDRYNLKDKIVLLKLFGTVKTGKTGDISFDKIEEFIHRKEAYSYLKNISQLKTVDSQVGLIDSNLENIDKIEESIFKEYNNLNPNEYNKYLPQLVSALSIEKEEDEKNAIFEDRLISELKNILGIEEII